MEYHFSHYNNMGCHKKNCKHHLEVCKYKIFLLHFPFSQPFFRVLYCIGWTDIQATKLEIHFLHDCKTLGLLIQYRKDLYLELTVAVITDKTDKRQNLVGRSYKQILKKFCIRLFPQENKTTTKNLKTFPHFSLVRRK